MVRDNSNFAKKTTVLIKKNDRDLRHDNRKLNEYLERHRKHCQTQSATEIPECRKGKFADDVKKIKRSHHLQRRLLTKTKLRIATQMRKLR
eukprot:11479776-Ditylum_brightwellii.AAC.1